MLGDEGALAALARAQTSPLDFFIDRRPARTVAFRELGDAHRPLASATCQLGFRNLWTNIHGWLVVTDRGGPGDHAREWHEQFLK